MDREFKITDARGGAAFTVRVVTRATQAEIVGLQEDGALKIRLTESPAGSEAANNELIAFLASRLDVDDSKIEIVAGANDRDKIISVVGISPGLVEERLHTSDTDEE
jgi:uncharacterized protein YggU (UPF0235/DUF167 family)